MTSAYALVNLNAIKHNLGQVHNYAPKTKIMAVLKADAYGHGLIEVAKTLDDTYTLAVSRIEEGIKLRQHGIKNKITVLEGFMFADELYELMLYDLEIVVHSQAQVNILEKYQGKKKIKIWLKLNTGMNRLGFTETAFISNHHRLSLCLNVKQPISLMTHLSSADETKNHTTLKQISLFNRVVKPYLGERSIANSAGIIAWPDSLADWVRPGIMLYGASPFSDRHGIDLKLKPALSLYSRLISIQNIKPSTSVGYSGLWVSKKNTKLGVVSIGYGDGYPRSAKTGTPLLINGKRVSLVGRVSMNMLTVDLSYQSTAKIGDLVTLWGNGLAVEEVAKHADTIPYDLLCGITQRVEKKSQTNSFQQK